MLRNSVIVRVGCADCGDFFDVDLIGISKARGGAYSLIDRHLTCRRTICRGHAYFVAAPIIAAKLTTLVSALDDPLRLNGMTAADLEPPPVSPGPGPMKGPPSLAALVHQIALTAEHA